MSYTYLFCDLRTNAILAELPLKNVSASRVLNGAGTFSASLSLNSISDLDPIGSTQPSRTAVYIDRDGVLIWGGIIWNRDYSSTGEEMTLGGSEFWSYFKGRRIIDTLTFTTADQLTIAQDLIDYAQAKAGGNIGIVVGSEVSGVTRDRIYYRYDLKPLAEAVEQLSAVQNGFDFVIDVGYSSGVPTKTLVLNYPRRGSLVSTTGLLFDYPGNVINFRWPEDGSRQALTSYAIGSGEGDAMIISSASRPDLIDAGYPLLEESKSYKDVTIQATLDAHARADVEAVAYPITVPPITIKANQDPVLGSYTVGDNIRIKVSASSDDLRICERFPDGLDTYKRIVSYTIHPDSETVVLAFGDA